MEINQCALFGTKLKQEDLKQTTGQFIEYETEVVGRVKITLSAYQDLLKGKYERYLIAGICRNRTLNGEEPALIDSNFLRGGYKEYNPPNTFDEKCHSLLITLYKQYGSQNIKFDFNTAKDCALAYSDVEECTRIMDQLDSKYYIKYENKQTLSRGRVLYMATKLTESGKEEAQKSLPKMPMVGLVDQNITTGDLTRDDKINQAKKLFFQEPQSFDNMRNACETLSYVL